MAKTVAVLFARKDSNYKKRPECDVYDIDRDAMTYTGNLPVIAHPPCRLWSRMKGLSTAPESEKQTAWFALEQVRKNGGVLEHPYMSDFWKAANLPTGLQRDEYGGFTLFIHQHWFGHKAQKKTYLYICGIDPQDVPPYKVTFDAVCYSLATLKGQKTLKKPEISKAEREHTPEELIDFLIQICTKIWQRQPPSATSPAAS